MLFLSLFQVTNLRVHSNSALISAQYKPGLLGAILFTRVEYFCPSTNFTLDVTTPAKYAATALAHHVGFGHVSPTATQQVTAVDPDRCRVTLPAIRTRKIYGCVFFTVRRRRVEINKITPPGFLVVGINWSKLERFVSFLFSPCIGPIPWKQKKFSLSNQIT